MNVPFFALDQLHRELAHDISGDWLDIMASSEFIGGERVEKFEQAWAEFCGVGHAVGVANGTDALELILRGLDIGEGDEVILPANTFVATAEAVVLSGAIPRFVDVDPHTLVITAEGVAGALGPRTAAVIAVHLYGAMPDMSALASLCRRKNLALIEDAAQAHGARQHGTRAGAWGVAAGFSFYPGKNLGAMGDAGAVTTSDPSLARRIRSLRDHGRSDSDRDVHDVVGRNSRLDAVQAAVLHRKLPRLDSWNRARADAADAYHRLLPDGVVPTTVVPGTEPVYHLMVVRVPQRDRVRVALADRGIGLAIHYPVPCHRQKAFHRYCDEPLPVCESAAAAVLSLPMHPHLGVDHVTAVCSALAEAVASSDSLPAVRIAR